MTSIDTLSSIERVWSVVSKKKLNCWIKELMSALQHPGAINKNGKYILCITRVLAYLL